MKLNKVIIHSLLAVTLFGTTASVASLGNEVTAHASSYTLPAKYRHTYYGKISTTKLKYVLGAKYAYFSDNGSSTAIKYKYVGNHNGWIGVKPVNGSYENTPFKLVGNRILIGYDTQNVYLHR